VTGRRRTARLARQLTETAGASALTIAARLAQPGDLVEAQRMVMEKPIAFAAAMQQATLRMYAEQARLATTLPMALPAAMMNAWLSIATAGLAPVRRRVRSNAKRLSRRRR
jgi:hypothetical protein